MNSHPTYHQVQIRALRDLAKAIPKNDMGLPTGIYRTDLLPFHDYIPPVGETPIEGLDAPLLEGSSVVSAVNTDPDPDRVLESEPTEQKYIPAPTEPRIHRTAGFPSKLLERAFVWLNYDEGFPTLESGIPFWGRLDFEPVDAYEAFRQYLLMSFGSEPNPEDETDVGKPASGTRSLAELGMSLVRGQITSAELIGIQTQLEEYYHLYYWGLRARAYDLFKVAQHRQQQEIRAIEVQDEHFLIARKFNQRLMDYMESEEDFWDMMTPKVAIDLLKQLSQMQRISVGLPAMGPPAEKDGPKGGQSFELAFRRTAQANNTSGQQNTDGDNDEALRVALEDPESTEVLQELIIKVSK